MNSFALQPCYMPGHCFTATGESNMGVPSLNGASWQPVSMQPGSRGQHDEFRASEPAPSAPGLENLFTRFGSADLNLPFTLGDEDLLNMMTSLEAQPNTRQQPSIKAESPEVRSDTGDHSNGSFSSKEHIDAHGQPCATGRDGSNDAASRRAAVQRRYRMKQASEMQTLEEAVAGKLAEAQKLVEENESLRIKERALQKLLSCRDEQVELLAKVRILCKGHTGMSGPFGTDPAAAVDNDLAILLRYKSITVEELRLVWKDFVTRVSGLVAALPTGSSSGTTAAQAQMAQINTLVSDVGVTMKHMIQLNCPVVSMLQQMNLETKAISTPDDVHYMRVISVLELTQQQQEDAVVMFSLYCDLMRKVHEERQIIKETMAFLAMQPHALADPILVAPGAVAMQEAEMVEKLYINLMKERSTRCLLCCFFFGRMLTNMQLAKLAVAAYPFFPDPLAASRVLAASLGKGPASSSSS